MKIESVLASENPIKFNCVNLAFSEVGLEQIIHLNCFKAASRVNNQPLEQETRDGAENRTLDGFTNFPNAIISIAIENGLFEENINGKDEYVDRGFVTLKLKFGDNIETYTAVSKGVIFPDWAVEETINKPGGFKDNTVGQTLQEKGVVKDHKDPQADLLCLETGVKTSREALLKEAVADVIKQAKLAERLSGAKIVSPPEIEGYVDKAPDKQISK